MCCFFVFFLCDKKSRIAAKLKSRQTRTATGDDMACDVCTTRFVSLCLLPLVAHVPCTHALAVAARAVLTVRVCWAPLHHSRSLCKHIDLSLLHGRIFLFLFSSSFICLCFGLRSLDETLIFLGALVYREEYEHAHIHREPD